MVKGWHPTTIEEGLYSAAKEYYEEHEEDLKIKHGIRSLSAFINHCLREHLKEIGAI